MQLGVTFENDGELIGGLAYRNLHWPERLELLDHPGHARRVLPRGAREATCDMKQFIYAWLGNDHTFGLSPGTRTRPHDGEMTRRRACCSTASATRPIWATSLVIVIEDDPSTGQDHVDMHRSISLFASPWVKHGYVSHGHYDVSSMHRLFAHVFGKPYRERGDRERRPAARSVHVDARLRALHLRAPHVHRRLVQPRRDEGSGARRAGGTSASPTSSLGSAGKSRPTCVGRSEPNGQSDFRYATSASRLSGASWAAAGPTMPGARRKTSSSVAALPSCRYGALSRLLAASACRTRTRCEGRPRRRAGRCPGRAPTSRRCRRRGGARRRG